MNNIDWHNLRSLDGSQNKAFEEICCQLAAYEKAPEGSKFIRKAAPDAGIECYWKLPNDLEWGWQAKYFLHQPDDPQWIQIGKSIRTALDRHPKLSLYYVCLPIDRQDPRNKQQWFMDKWNAEVETWNQWAKDKGMSIQFEYWGEHEIIERLSRDEHRGRFFFWFNKEFFSDEWFKKYVENNISNVGARYTPELNVDLPIAKIFNGLGRSKQFYDRITIFLVTLRKKYSKISDLKAEQIVLQKFPFFESKIQELLTNLQNIESIATEKIDFDSINQLLSIIEPLARDMYRLIGDEISKLRNSKETTKAEIKDNKREIERNISGLNYYQNNLDRLCGEFNDLEEFINTFEAKLTNTSALLLSGKAGIGKTHLFCDIAKTRTENGIPTIFVLGQHFTNNDPLMQLIQMHGLTCTPEEFFGALESAAQSRKAKALILIDALNEGEGKKIWYGRLSGILTAISRYSWISIGLSTRSSYEDIIVPDGLIPTRITKVIHYGFEGYEYQATKTFFDYHKIERPSIPLLIPEFQNPLFLKIFCNAIISQGHTKLPAGLEGVTAIFKFYIDSINSKLSRPDQLDYDKKSNLVQKAIRVLVENMAAKSTSWLPHDVAQCFVNSLLPRSSYDNSLFRYMVSEGVLDEDRIYVNNGYQEIIQFTYERFTDHLITQYLIEKYLDLKHPEESFILDKPLGSILKDEEECYSNRGMIEALMIQIPEMIKKELVELAPHIKEYQPIREAFIESLIWRDSKAIYEETRKYINEQIILYEDTNKQFLDALLTIATNPRHPYNADFLNKHLWNYDLSNRDAWWSIFLFYEYGEHRTVDRLIEWAWFDDKTQIEEESIRLCAITLTWFLTTSHRFLRDRATKALVSLLTKHIDILETILRNFLNVNDPYVLERLFAVAYGCAMRSTDDDKIKSLAQHIYDDIFKDGHPPPNILLRDYARGIIELAISRKIKIIVDISKIRPPYKSDWPSFVIPSEEELRKYSEWKNDMPERSQALVHLYNSVMGFEDFARYVIGTNSGSFEWTSLSINKKRPFAKKEEYESFVYHLTKKQKIYWTQYLKIRDNVAIFKRLELPEKQKLFGKKVSDKFIDKLFITVATGLRDKLGKRKSKLLDSFVIPYLNLPQSKQEERFVFDLSIAQRWIFQKILNLGWDANKFGEFDRNVSRYSNRSRESSKPERIGKKYQWIAYYEFLARVSDNFKYKIDSWSNSKETYEGPWQIGYVRNIDPSNTLKNTGQERWKSNSNPWWSPIIIQNWEDVKDDSTWLQNKLDLPEFEKNIQLINPKDKSNWVCLEGFYLWNQPAPVGEERYERSHKEIWMMLKSYLVKKKDKDTLFKWAKEQNFSGRWMPESHDNINIFLGEYFWSPAFLYHYVPYYNHDGWTRNHDKRIPKNILVTTDQYLNESSTYDCSIDETVHVYLPCKLLVDKMNLHWHGIEGHYFDNLDNLVAFDPSIGKNGPGCLLINQEALVKFLQTNDYDILWIVLAEKNILGGNNYGSDQFKGRLEISGAYRFQEKQIKGILNFNFLKPHQ